MTRPPPIYLDYAATTPLDPRVAEAMQQAMLAGYANPASQHRGGQEARKRLEWARGNIASPLSLKSDGVPEDRLIFTSGGTEANNLALLGLPESRRQQVIISAIEHPSIEATARELARRGADVKRIPVNKSGVIDLERARELLAQAGESIAVSVMLANNETGVIQPIRELALLCRETNSSLHTDAVQFVGKFPIVLGELFPTLGVATLSYSAHKIGGPVGIGALLVRHDVSIEPRLYGGFQQGAIRPGTESLLLAEGFCVAMISATAEVERRTHVLSLRSKFESNLREHFDDLVINGEAAERLPHISNIAFLGVDRQQLFLALDFAGVYCSTGSACASGSSEPSPVLRAMGLPEEVISSSLRFSFGSPTTREEIDEAVERIVKCVKHLRSQKSARK